MSELDRVAAESVAKSRQRDFRDLMEEVLEEPYSFLHFDFTNHILYKNLDEKLDLKI